MLIKDLVNGFHLLKEAYQILKTNYVSNADESEEENRERIKEFYELPIYFKDKNGMIHKIHTSTIDFDKDGNYALFLLEPNEGGGYVASAFYQHEHKPLYDWSFSKYWGDLPSQRHPWIMGE